MVKYQSDFLRRVVPGVLRLQKRTGWPASVVLAHAILESNWGRSRLARRNRHLYGIKLHPPAGPPQRAESRAENFPPPNPPGV